MLSNLIGTLNNYDDDVHGHITCPELGKTNHPGYRDILRKK